MMTMMMMTMVVGLQALQLRRSQQKPEQERRRT
jgi:hypothetical protein